MWRFYMNNTIPLNETEITNASDTYINMQWKSWANITAADKTVYVKPTFDWDKEANFTHTQNAFE